MTGEGFEIGIRTVASGNPGGSNGWDGMGQKVETEKGGEGGGEAEMEWGGDVEEED